MNTTERVVCGLDFDSPHAKEALAELKKAGVTSVQIYTFWRFFEPEKRGEFDWSYYDRQVRMIQEAGLKWVPFLLIGPKYAAPAWWLEDPAHVGLVCLEHNRESLIESIWNPEFRTEIKRVVAAFADHYASWNVIESVQPGICGDYGESIMPVHGNWPGDYHTHRGYWCGDAYARADFVAWLKKRFKSLEELNHAWRTGYGDWLEVEPFRAHQMPSRTAWFDFIDWYRGAMTDFVDFWMGCCRKNFPGLPIYMCTGGLEDPEDASHFSNQAKVCARHQGGLRLTNETNRYFDNFFLTAYTHSACQFYGAYLGLEPVGPLTAEGVAARIFGSADYGNRQIFFYTGNLFAVNPETGEVKPDGRTETYKRYIDLIVEHDLKAEVAFFWPELVGALGGGIPDGIKPLATWLRTQLPVMPVSDSMILDGALERFRLLIVPMTAFARRKTLHAISKWVEAGGVLLALGDLTDIELERVPEYDALFGISAKSELAAGHAQYRPTGNPDFPKFNTGEAFGSEKGWLGLARDTEILAEVVPHDKPLDPRGMPQPKQCAAGFRRRAGRGTAIAWYGPKNFEFDPQSLFRHPVLLPLLLEDVLALYTHTKPDPAQAGEVVRAEIGGKTRVLTEEFSIRDV